MANTGRAHPSDRATRASPEPASGLGQKASAPCAVRLTKGQSAFFRAVASGQSQMFHRSVIEPTERLGLVVFDNMFRLAGCNSFSSSRFSLTEAGKALAVSA